MFELTLFDCQINWVIWTPFTVFWQLGAQRSLPKHKFLADSREGSFNTNNCLAVVTLKMSTTPVCHWLSSWPTYQNKTYENRTWQMSGYFRLSLTQALNMILTWMIWHFESGAGRRGEGHSKSSQKSHTTEWKVKLYSPPWRIAGIISFYVHTPPFWHFWTHWSSTYSDTQSVLLLLKSPVINFKGC